MVQTAEHQETIRSLKGKLHAVYEYFIEQQDQVNAEKVKQLAKKLGNWEFVIAFCGHFSAGKSTMINRVVGENLLPSSPIPTSANLVKVVSGEEYAKVFFKEGRPRLYLAPYDFEMVKNYCKDGDQIKEIEISHHDSRLPDHTVIMDTPGIDSADDAHRIATESAMHLADLIFYVMDYNHVQSELNFLFTKELTEAGKDVFLVINQIDKHTDEELSFSEFQKSVVDSFVSWGVKPKGIFYTSLKKNDHAYNQFSELKQFIAQKLNDKDQVLVQSIFQSLKKITEDHLQSVKTKEEARLQPFKGILNELTVDQQENLSEAFDQLNTDMEAASVQLTDLEKEFDDETANIMKNTYLMPFQTRALAEAYLESCQPEFKVGFLFSKQKTQQEREERLRRFYVDLQEKVKSQLEWHLREYILRALKENKLDHSDLLAKAQAMEVDFPVELLAGAVKAGARLSGEYVLNYTEDVVNEIKKIAKNHLSHLKEDLLTALQQRNAEVKAKLENKFTSIKRYVSAFEKIKESANDHKLIQIKIDGLLQSNSSMNISDDLFEQEAEEFEVIYGGDVSSEKSAIEEKLPQAKMQTKIETNRSEQSGDRLQAVAEKVRKTSQLINSLPGFKKLALELEEKAARLDHKGFTVALFGAFSAGKSSFANALIGEKVLPVSPNPTTAAINRIKPIDSGNPHGTVLVKLKEEQAMLDDLNRSLKVFDLHTEDLEDALIKLDMVEKQSNHDGALEKTNYAFLNAFKKGKSFFGNQLGELIKTDISEFSDFVAKEEKSCFVEWIDLYYDCQLTRKGITLVDTPGADSINARHTGVAFDFIKNSDAILFVTYYNHAFSKADREFLIQLGRVKDSFQVDKMFFIINAIDLAENEEDKHTVAEYVQNQLLKYGVRNPHLFSLSSMLALKEKNGHTDGYPSGMRTFEDAFYQFIANDLTAMAVAASENELRRVYELVGKLIASAKEDLGVKEQKRKDIEKEKAVINRIVKDQSVQHLQTRLSQEAEELIYYIKQRVFFRFGDFFKEAFNPSVLRDDGRNLKKALKNALDELVEAVGFDFAQEMRATTVRLDRFAEKMAADFHKGLTERLAEINPDLSFSEFEFKNNGEIAFETAFKTIDEQLFAKALSYFKNPKSFFEKNEKKLMSEEINRVLQTPADEYLQVQHNRITRYYAHVLEREMNRLLEQVSEQTDEFYLSLLSALDGGVSIEQLLEIQRKLTDVNKG